GLVAICRRSRTFPSGRTGGGIHTPLQIWRSLLRAQARLAARRVSTHPRKSRNASIRQLAIRVRFGWLAFSYCRTNVCGEQIAQAPTSTDIVLAAVPCSFNLISWTIVALSSWCLSMTYSFLRILWAGVLPPEAR